MGRFTVKEATEFFRSSDTYCSEKLVQEWMNDRKTMNINYGVSKDDLISFEMWKQGKRNCLRGWD